MSEDLVQARDDTEDAEVYRPGPKLLGPPVEAAAESRTLYGTITASRQHARPPLVPAWVRNRQQRAAFVLDGAKIVGYEAAKHTIKSPKYLVKALFWGFIGIFVGAYRLGRWALVGELLPSLWHAVEKKDYAEGHKIFRTASHSRKVRAYVLLGAIAAVLTAGLAVHMFAPVWAQTVVAVGVVCALARFGRPSDRPIIERTVIDAGFTRLTAEMVRTALCALEIGAMKDPAALKFRAPGIHRDGPGYMAIVSLPGGVTATKVLNKREELSSALRLPVDQVWPEAGPDHAGQVALWVGRVPASQMGRAKWALATPNALTSAFEPIPIGVDPRMRPVAVTPFERNFLIGGQPGSGKTFAGRAIVLGGLLDPTAEVWLAAFKPSEDFYDVSEYCTRYECGVDPVTMTAAEQMVVDALAEVQRRQKLLGKLKREGKISEGRTNPELARAGIGLHPLYLVFDEFHELMLASKEAAEGCIRLTKQGRSAGVIGVFITQVAGKDSVPPELTRCISSRWCLSVADQVANDQIMGTGAYKRGLSGTAYRPRVDAGWGVTDGMADDSTPVRAYYPDDEELKVVLDRIRELRGGGANVTTQAAQRSDVLDDVLRVFAYAGRPGLSWQRLAELLAEQKPEAYAGMGAEALSALVRDKGVPSEDIKEGGRSLKGCKQIKVAGAQTPGIGS